MAALKAGWHVMPTIHNARGSDLIVTNGDESIFFGVQSKASGTPDHIGKIVSTYQFRTEEDRYSKRVSMERIAEEGYNLNISRYISTAVGEEQIDLAATHAALISIEGQISDAAVKHNAFLKALGLPLLPTH